MYYVLLLLFLSSSLPSSLASHHTLTAPPAHPPPEPIQLTHSRSRPRSRYARFFPSLSDLDAFSLYLLPHLHLFFDADLFVLSWIYERLVCCVFFSSLPPSFSGSLSVIFPSLLIDCWVISTYISICLLSLLLSLFLFTPHFFVEVMVVGVENQNYPRPEPARVHLSLISEVDYRYTFRFIIPIRVAAASNLRDILISIPINITLYFTSNRTLDVIHKSRISILIPK